MTGTDPVELFKQLDPTRHLNPDVQRRNADILAHVLEQPRPINGPISSRSRRRRWIIGGGLVTMVLATAAFAVLRTAPVSDPRAVSCMATTDRDGDRIGLPATDDPIEACRQLWEDGTLGSGEVPPLAACLNDAGAAVVYPSGRAICSQLGLEEAEPGLTDDQRQLITLQESLSNTFLEDCFAQDDAVVETQRQLDEAGLIGWVVDVPEPFTESGLCAGPGLDIDNNRVVLSGVREP